MNTRVGQLVALVNVYLTTWALEAGLTFAFVVVSIGDALGSVSTGLVGTVIHFCALRPGPATWARALVRVQC